MPAAPRPDNLLNPFALQIRYWGYEQRPTPWVSVSQLAKAFGMSHSTVQSWFQDGKRPRLSAIGQIARIMAGEGHEEAASTLAQELALKAGYPAEEAARAFVFAETPYARMKRKLLAYAADHHISDKEAEELITLLEQDRTEYEAQRSGVSAHHDTPMLAY